MSGRGLDVDSVSAVKICSLLDSLRAIHNARHSPELRDLLGEHVVALLREFVPADNVSIGIGEESVSNARLQEHGKRGASLRQVSLTSLDGKRFRLTAPILAQGEPVGILTLERSEKTFGEPELLVLSAFARMASLAFENARYVEALEDQIHQLRRNLQFEDNMAGESEALEKLRRDIHRVAVRDTTVLIVGESGTGKELVARSIHGQSPRAIAAFVAINCAALTESLLETELFGHEKGAFTGATGFKRGLLETAQGGTVFLDEIGEMSLSAQAKLLRILQNREMQRVGGTESIALDVRVVAATNCDLQAAVRQGTFREDLFYRLDVVTLCTPPLRERPEDILPLAHHFARFFGVKCGRPNLTISPTVRSMLQSYDWPGNVRELENAIEHAAVLGAGDTIQPEDLPERLLEHWAELKPEETGMLQRAITSAKRATVKRAFEMSGGDHTEAARVLGVHPNYLYRLLKNLNFPTTGLF
jgi:Nif-specific regulatory protein